MKANPIFKKLYFLFFLPTCFSVYADGQQRIPKNYFGASGIAELNRLALGTGVEYERWLFTKDQFAIGAKAHYIFPSKTINYIFSSNDGVQESRQVQLMGTSYFFTNPDKEIKGFFLSLAGGINFIRWEAIAYDGSGNRYNRSINEVSPGFEVAAGGQIVANRNAFRFTGGYQAFPADKYSDFQSGNGISLFYTKISFGF